MEHTSMLIERITLLKSEPSPTFRTELLLELPYVRKEIEKQIATEQFDQKRQITQLLKRVLEYITLPIPLGSCANMATKRMSPCSLPT